MQLNDTLLPKGAVIQEHRRTADVFIVSDPAEPGNRVSWCACLLGGCIAAPDYAIHGQGAAVWSAAALNRDVKLLISAAWAEKHQTNAELTKACIATWKGNAKKTRWQLISQTDFDGLVNNRRTRCEAQFWV